MSWKVSDVMSQRMEFVSLASVEGANFAELCRRYEVSRKTGYKWLQRYRQHGQAGLEEQSRKPLASPLRTVETIERLVLDVREEHPAWGGRKIRARLLALGHSKLPAVSTITEILRRHGRITPEATFARQHYRSFERTTPNDLWQIDFKGEVTMSNKQDCYPLTIVDDHSRYLVCLQACPGPDLDTVKQRLTAVFQRYGLPQSLYCDNGPPWGSVNSPLGHTRLTAWLMRHDVEVIHGRPYHPQGRGKEERFHRTLVDELLQGHVLADFEDAQAKFDPFREMYNHVRPHEALEMHVPASRYAMSPRPFQSELPEFIYPDHFECRCTNPQGQFQFKTRTIKTSEAFSRQTIGLAPTNETHLWNVYFCHFHIGQLDLNDAIPRIKSKTSKTEAQ